MADLVTNRRHDRHHCVIRSPDLVNRPGHALPMGRVGDDLTRGSSADTGFHRPGSPPRRHRTSHPISTEGFSIHAAGADIRNTPGDQGSEAGRCPG